MALFHLHVTQVKRSAGQSVVTSAAYRAGVIAAAAILCMVGFKGQSKEVYLGDMQGETLPDGGTRYDLGDGDFVIEPGN